MNDYTFGNFICMLRERKGLTQQDIADQLGITPAAVSKWENGSAKPRVQVLFQLADILGVRAEELMAGKFLNTETIDARAVKEINERYLYLSKIDSYSLTRVKVKRLIASFIDLLIVTVAVWLAATITNQIAISAQAPSGTVAAAWILCVLFVFLILWIFHDLIGIGKRLLGLVILDKNSSEKANIKQKVLRNTPLIGCILLSPSLLFIDVIIMLVRGLSIGDSLANTVVVEKAGVKEGDYEYADEEMQADISAEENNGSLQNIDLEKINSYNAPPTYNKKILKVLSITIAAVLLIAICLLTVYFKYYDSYGIVSTDIATYEEDCATYRNASDFMPDLESLSDYTDLYYSHKTWVSSKFMGFVSDGLALFVQYDESVYEMKKAEILDSYTFLTTPIIEDDTFIIPTATFSYNRYTLKIVRDNSYSKDIACKSFALIGFDDQNKSIVYCYHYDFDLDYIAERDCDPKATMCEFMDRVFEWKTVD